MDEIRKISHAKIFIILVSFIFFTSFFIAYRFSNSKISLMQIDCGLKEYKSFNESTSIQHKFNIFFIETNDQRNNFTSRQLCAIESAAKNNPNAIIHVWSLKAVIHEKLQKNYKNIKFSLMNLGEIFYDTPLHDWWANNKLTKHSEYFRYAHLADALRLVALYKYGGIYVDLDMITLRDYESLLTHDGIGTEVMNGIATGNAFIISANKSSPFLHEVLKQFASTYRPNEWGTNGPDLIKRVLQSYCKVDDLSKLLLSSNSNIPNDEGNLALRSNTCKLYIYPFYYFYPIHYSQIKEIFKKDSSIKVSSFIHSYAIHFNNYLSRTQDTKKYQFSVFEFFFNLNCPVSYEKF